MHENALHIAVKSYMSSFKRQCKNPGKVAGVLWKFVRFVIIFGTCFIIIYPFLMKFIVAFMAQEDLYDPTVKYLPRHFSVENIIFALNDLQWKESIPLSFSLSILVSLFTLISCTVTAYGFARFNFPFKKILFSIVIFTLIVPPQATVLSTFLKFRYFDIFGIYSLITGEKGISLMNTFTPFIMMSGMSVGFRNGLYIYLMRQYFRGIPRVLDEASAIDGAGVFRTFFQVNLPGSVPMLVTVFLFSFAWQWTDYFYSSLFASKMKLISVLLPSISAYLDTIIASMARNTGTLILVVPLIVIYILLQRFIVEGIERTGIVG